MRIWGVATHEQTNDSLMTIQNEWDINDLADAHEMIEWRNASTLDAKRKQDLENKAARR